ncbi:MAG: DUF6502 family protein [Burkholderiales bacterium]
MDTPQHALRAAVMRLLRPLVRLLLRHGVAYDAFADLAERVYVDIAMDEFGIPGRKQTVSRVSILTGLTRKEVARLQALRPAQDNAAQERYHRAARVVAGWVRDADFAGNDGEPAVLPVQDGASSFAALVRRYSGDMPVRAVLDELVRVGAVARESDGRVRLLARAYIPEASDVDKLQILGADVADLIRTIDHNLQHGHAEPLFQRKAMYDNLPLEALPRLRALGAKHAQRLIEQADAWLSAQDRDVTPGVQGTGRARAGIGIFYFEETLEPSKTEERP